MLIQYGMLIVTFLPSQNHMFSQIFTEQSYVFSLLLKHFSIHYSCLHLIWYVLFMVQDEQVNERKISQLKSFASKAIERNDYISASAFYTKVSYSALFCVLLFLFLILWEKIMHVNMHVFKQSSNYGWVTKWQGLVIEKETWPMALSRDNYLEKYS